MAFLAYVLRGSIDNIRNYLDIFPEACVRLLRDCPPEDVATRKVAMSKRSVGQALCSRGPLSTGIVDCDEAYVVVGFPYRFCTLHRYASGRESPGRIRCHQP
jgi:hypothetical protein